jgi:uncharacterized protein (DUF488 family)
LAHPFFTVGHSTRSIADFVALLQEAEVKLVADVRMVPRSRRNPQYNRDVLPATLASFDLSYMHVPELGGLRKQSLVPPVVNGFWENQSFHNYADYAMSSEFRQGLLKLGRAGHARRCAIMCAEGVWWRCHRRIIADYLIAAGEIVVHILGPGRTELARSTPVAVPGPSGVLVYPGAPTANGGISHREQGQSS